MTVKKFVIKGKVQGVSFRYSAEKKAIELGAKGWVRNEPDGTVHMVVSGDDRVLRLMKTWIIESSPGILESLDVIDYPEEDFDTFYIQY
ncbi:MAG: acylphosphatase [bacterium]